MQERLRQRREVDLVASERDLLGAQLVRRNDELALLYHKTRLQQAALAQARARPGVPAARSNGPASLQGSAREAGLRMQLPAPHGAAGPSGEPAAVTLRVPYGQIHLQGLGLQTRRLR